MAKPLCWYKNIKPGDVLEVKFLPGHCFFRPSSPEEIHEVRIETVYGTDFFGGSFIKGSLSDYNDINLCVADFDNSIFNQVRFLRKIKQGEKK